MSGYPAKLKHFVLAALAGTLIFCPSTIRAASFDLYVDKDSEETEEGTQDKPYRSLAKALEHALASVVGVLLIIPSIHEWNIENSAFQIYLMVTNILLLFVVYRKKLIFQFRETH